MPHVAPLLPLCLSASLLICLSLSLRRLLPLHPPFSFCAPPISFPAAGHRLQPPGHALATAAWPYPQRGLVILNRHWPYSIVTGHTQPSLATHAWPFTITHNSLWPTDHTQLVDIVHRTRPGQHPPRGLVIDNRPWLHPPSRTPSAHVHVTHRHAAGGG